MSRQVDTWDLPPEKWPLIDLSTLEEVPSPASRAVASADLPSSRPELTPSPASTGSGKRRKSSKESKTNANSVDLRVQCHSTYSVSRSCLLLKLAPFYNKP